MLDFIRTSDDPILRKESSPVNLSDHDEVQQCAKELQNAFERVLASHEFTSSAGLSLVQIGIPKRACVVWFPGEEPFIMLNPEIVWHAEETDDKYEGCLSFFEPRGLVTRYSEIEIRYSDKNLNVSTRCFSGWPARIIQHEIDHMNGVLYSDRMKQPHILINHRDYSRIKPYTKIQNIAKDVMYELLKIIKPGVTEQDIAFQARQAFHDRGVRDFWYYDVAALVLIGERSILSVSGRDYTPSADTKVVENDLVTIDLSPVLQGSWGDYARSIYVQNGTARFSPCGASGELVEGFNAQANLHDSLLSIANPDMTAHELWSRTNAKIRALGFEHLDFKGNIGHSIEKNMNDRKYIEEGNNSLLGDMEFFTFEPHIRKPNSSKGFKHENIHYFAGNKIQII